CLQDVESFDNKNVGTINFNPLVWNDVVDEMRIDRCACRAAAGFDVGKEAQQRWKVIAFRKAFLLHQIFAFKDGIWKKKSIRRDEVNLWHIGPPRQQRLKYPRRCRLADSNGARDTDDVRHLGIFCAEKAL